MGVKWLFSKCFVFYGIVFAYSLFVLFCYYTRGCRGNFFHSNAHRDVGKWSQRSRDEMPMLRREVRAVGKTDKPETILRPERNQIFSKPNKFKQQEEEDEEENKFKEEARDEDEGNEGFKWEDGNGEMETKASDGKAMAISLERVKRFMPQFYPGQYHPRCNCPGSGSVLKRKVVSRNLGFFTFGRRGNLITVKCICKKKKKKSKKPKVEKPDETTTAKPTTTPAPTTTTHKPTTTTTAKPTTTEHHSANHGQPPSHLPHYGPGYGFGFGYGFGHGR